MFSQIALLLLIVPFTIQSAIPKTNLLNQQIRVERNVQGQTAVNSIAEKPLDKQLNPENVEEKEVHGAVMLFRPLFVYREQQDKEKKYWEQRRIEATR